MCAFFLSKIKPRKKMAKFLPVVSREYVKQYMREPLPDERECVNGEKCWSKCYYGFALREFIFPGEPQQKAAPAAQAMCIMCNRYEAAVKLMELRIK